MTDEQKPKSKRGFASMSPEQRREIAAKGGRSIPAEKRSFSQNPEIAARAGRKGGAAVNPENRTFSRSSDLASKAGQKGGLARRKTQVEGRSGSAGADAAIKTENLNSSNDE